VLHQLVRALRSGAIEKTAFLRVVLVGHGLGSITAGEHPPGCGRRGADRLSHFSPSDASLPSLIPANQDPHFARRSLDDDYLTTAPGSREVSFRSALMTQPDPRLMTLDEAVKETITTAELRTASGTDLGSQLCDPGAGPDDGRAVRSRGLWRRIHLREPGSDCGSVPRSRSAVLRGGRVPGDRRGPLACEAL
jgi:hypothetical protein